MRRYTPEERRVLADSAERQMRQWTLRAEIWEKVHDEKERPQWTALLGPCLAISRQAGAGGGEIAAKTAERLGIPVHGRELLDQLADRIQAPRDMLEFLDEKPANWVHETFGAWIDKHAISQEEYVVRLGRMILLAAAQGAAVFIGRGAQFLLPPDRQLRVRLIAPESYRVERTRRMRNVSLDEARNFVAETDRGRADFVRRYFHKDVDDPRLYDVCLDVSRFGVDGCVEVLATVFQQLFASREAKEVLQ